MATAAHVKEENPDAKLIRAIGLGGATLLVIGNVIGSGIFLTTGIMAERVPSATLLLLAWVVGGLITLAGGLTCAEMGSMYPRSGGWYVYLSEAYGPLCGFMFGWASLLVIVTGSVAAVAVGFAEYFSYFFPALSTSRQILAVPMPWGAFSISAGQLVAAASIAVLGVINYFGVRSGNAVQASLTILKIAALVALPLLAFSVQRTTPEFTPVIPAGVPRPAAAFGVAMVLVMWTYMGWDQMTNAAGEIENPRRNLPRALLLGMLAVTIIYVIVNLAYMFALSISEMSGVVRIAERAVSALVGESGAKLVAAMVMVSTFGCNAAGVIGMSRMCYAMSSDKLFIRSAAAVHPVYRSPHVAIILTCAWAILLTLTGTYVQLLTYSTFTFTLFSVAIGLAIFKLRRSRPDTPRPYRTWGYPVVPLLFVCGSLALVVNTLIEIPGAAIAGLGIAVMGLPAYWYWRK